MDNGGLTSENI